MRDLTSFAAAQDDDGCHAPPARAGPSLSLGVTKTGSRALRGFPKKLSTRIATLRASDRNVVIFPPKMLMRFPRRSMRYSRPIALGFAARPTRGRTPANVQATSSREIGAQK